MLSQSNDRFANSTAQRFNFPLLLPSVLCCLEPGCSGYGRTELHYVAFLQILVPGSETLPTSANICLLNQPLLSKPLLVVAVDIHLTCASLTQSGEGPRMGRQDSHSFVMLLFFVVMSYHVSDILLVRSVDAISSSLVCAKLTNSPGAPNPNFHKSTGVHISCKDKWESLRVNRDTVSKMYQKTTLRSFRNFGFIILDY